MFRVAVVSIVILLYVSVRAQPNQTLGCNELWFHGEGTHYGGVAGSAGGHCGIYVDSADIYTVAMNHIQYDSSNACGACVRVLGPKGEVTLKVVDECPECKFGDLDVTTAVFPQLSEMKDGRVQIAWQYTPCPKVKDIRLVFAPGTGPYYFKMQVLDMFYPIVKLEYRQSDGSYAEIGRAVYNYYVAQGGIDEVKTAAGPYSFRFTGSSGEVLYTDTISYRVDEPVHSGVQFADVRCPDCAGVLGGTAQVDFCGVCSGGATGIAPNSACAKDCAGYWDGTAYLDECGLCVAGFTGATPCGRDCNGVRGGKAFVDHCGTCVAGDTGLEACAKDCRGDWGGTAIVDSCGVCAGGATGTVPNLDPSACERVQSLVLQAGWNMISLNVVPADSTVGAVFSRLDVAEIKNMDLFWSADLSEYSNGLTAIVAGEGYLVKMNAPGILNVRGKDAPASQYVIAGFGWHLVGCASQSPVPIADVLDLSQVSRIVNLDSYWSNSCTVGCIEVFEPGKAYFVQMK